MNHLTRLSVAALMLSGISTASLANEDKGWVLFAGADEDFIYDPTLSVMLGMADSNDLPGSAAFSWGLEASFNCPLIQPPTNNIRQQVSYFSYSDGDSDFQSLEINPHYVFELSEQLGIGAGPGLGYTRAEVGDDTANMIALQLGASAHYNMDKIFIGAEARYQFTQSDDIGTSKDSGANNWRTVLKVGYNF